VPRFPTGLQGLGRCFGRVPSGSNPGELARRSFGISGALPIAADRLNRCAAALALPFQFALFTASAWPRTIGPPLAIAARLRLLPCSVIHKLGAAQTPRGHHGELGPSPALHPGLSRSERPSLEHLELGPNKDSGRAPGPAEHLLARRPLFAIPLMICCQLAAVIGLAHGRAARLRMVRVSPTRTSLIRASEQYPTTLLDADSRKSHGAASLASNLYAAAESCCGKDTTAAANNRSRLGIKGPMRWRRFLREYPLLDHCDCAAAWIAVRLLLTC